MVWKQIPKWGLGAEPLVGSLGDPKSGILSE